MADYLHLDNLIQGEVLRIKERRPLDQQYDALKALESFLEAQTRKVLIEKIRVKDELAMSEERQPEPPETAD